MEIYFNDSMQTVHAYCGGGGGSQQREVGDGLQTVRPPDDSAASRFGRLNGIVPFDRLMVTAGKETVVPVEHKSNGKMRQAYE